MIPRRHCTSGICATPMLLHRYLPSATRTKDRHWRVILLGYYPWLGVTSIIIYCFLAAKTIGQFSGILKSRRSSVNSPSLQPGLSKPNGVHRIPTSSPTPPSKEKSPSIDYRAPCPNKKSTALNLVQEKTSSANGNTSRKGDSS